MTTQRKLSDQRTAPGRLACLVLICLCSGAFATQAASHTPIWQSEFHQGHPLTGQIWQSSSGEFVTPETLMTSLRSHDLILIGEKHDNPDHHQLRLQLLEPLFNEQLVSLIAFEMMSQAQQPALDALDHTQALDEETLRSLLQWDEQGWPWDRYGPLVTMAVNTQVSVRAANIDRDDVMQIYRGQTAEGSPQRLNEIQLARLTDDIDISHCGMLPQSQFQNMVRVQQARDQQMADSLTYGSADHNPRAGLRVLIAGNYHIRHDLGVPNYLPADSTTPLSIAFLEVDPGRQHAAEYLQAVMAMTVYDYIWFTPAVRNDDYCADMHAASTADSDVSGSSSRSDN